MKKIYIIISLIAAFLMQSCSLDEPTYGKTTTENFYKKQSDIEYALTGAYLQFRLKWKEYALTHHFVGDISTDDALKGASNDGDRRELYEISTFTISTGNGDVNMRWYILYQIVNRCNDVIYYAPQAAGDKQILARYANEAKALRAFAYYNLVTTFGEVPLLSTPMTPNEILGVTRSPVEDVYQLIEQDLKDASALPAKGEYSSDDAYRVTRGFAKVMLAKVYMFRNDFVSAEKILEEVVEKDKDYDLLPDYGMNWRREYENSIESVFEIPYKMYSNDKITELGTNVPHYFTSRRVGGYQGYGFKLPTQDLMDAYEPGDPRITYVFTRTGDRYVGDDADQDNSESTTGYHDYKMTVPRIDKEGYDAWMIPYNIRIIRYSDVLLLYAEALNENGNSGKALLYLNKVRQRARNTNPIDPRRSKQAYIPPTDANTLSDITVTNKDQLREKIWHERRLELALEGWRRDDLMRQKRFGTVMRAYATKYNSEKGKHFDDNRDYLFPIPQGERDKSHGMLTQNPGF
nr:RagB/SusD family nutrient uptake outer membrane protein [Bacteroides intestinalis]